MTEELDRSSGESSSRGRQAAWAPAIEVQQREGSFVIRAELAGMKADDVTIDVTDDAVTISGERREEQEVEREGVRVTERRYGHFFRSIPLPKGAQTEQAKARFENGLLDRRTRAGAALRAAADRDRTWRLNCAGAVWVGVRERHSAHRDARAGPHSVLHCTMRVTPTSARA